MRRIRVCELITELRPAGAERCVFNLASRLDRGRFEAHVVALRGGAVADRLREAGIPTTVLGVRGKWDAMKFLRLAKFLRKGGYDILHTHLFHADVAGRVARWLAGGPIHLCHTIHVAEMRFRPWHFAWARFLDGTCDQLITVSRAVADHHARRSGLPLARYRVVVNGTDIEAFQRRPEARVRLRREWNVSDEQVVLAFVGRLDRQKGLDVLLAALRRLHENGRAPRVVLAGDGPQRAMLEAFLRTPAGRSVRWLGFVEDVASVFSAVDALVLPSRWEGLPNSALEAMAASLPVIASEAPGASEVVLPGRTGLLVPVDDPVALAEAMTLLAGDTELRRRMGQAGNDRVRSCYSIEQTVRAHELLYEEIAGRE